MSLEVGGDESVGLVGESGSGKTTLSRILLGLETATSGQVVIDGIDASDWTKLSTSDRRRLRGAVQIVFQDPYSSLNPMRTVGGTLSEAITVHNPGAKNVSGQVADLLSPLGSPPLTRRASRSRFRAASGSGWPSPARLRSTRGS